MAVPILKQGDVMIAFVQDALSDDDLRRLRDDLANRVGKERVRALIIDVTALDVLDSYASRTIRGIAQVARLRGARPMVVGIQPDVAFAMVQLGLTLDDIETALDLDDGLEQLRRTTDPGIRHGTGNPSPDRR